MNNSNSIQLFKRQWNRLTMGHSQDVLGTTGHVCWKGQLGLDTGPGLGGPNAFIKVCDHSPLAPLCPQRQKWLLKNSSRTSPSRHDITERQCHPTAQAARKKHAEPQERVPQKNRKEKRLAFCHGRKR